MSNGWHTREPPRLRSGVLPRSPAEALEPTRAPSRPRGTRRRREPRRTSPTVRRLSAVMTFIVVIATALAAGAIWIDREFDRPGPLAAPKTIVVRKGEGARDVARRLEAEGVIASQHLFVGRYVARSMSTWFGGTPLQIKAGDYLFEPGQSMREVAAELDEGKSVLFSVSVPEGLTSFQIVERLKAEPILSGEITTIPEEGSLLPETYKVPRGMARQALIDMMQAESRQFLAKAWASRAPGLPLRTPREALVLASIIEKETGRKDERERVAAVFINRLKQGMRLQSDPTILYGLEGGQTDWGRPILKSEIQGRTAHNTYQIQGLPPTPICNPGKASISAALNPANTKDLYFVADGTGGHVFSETIKEHNAAVGAWRKVEEQIRARQQAEKARMASAESEPARATEDAGGQVPLPVRKPKR
ncbi:MAG TPA: endolytic transglycosylase MltG [Hyphomicrobiaceae bacterium]|nr:endolytic transglycosylase MltG [Hyphomicrobiaceae bacterium]